MSNIRFEALDGWRGVCAILVTLFHVATVMPIGAGFVIRTAWIFVDFFFVLSGFVITHADGRRLENPQAVVPFVARRFGRLWPLHVTVLGFLVALECIRLLLHNYLPDARPAFSANHSLSSILTNLLLVQSLGTETMLTWNGPAWSISVEFCTYLVFAGLTVAVAGRRQSGAVKTLLIGLSLISLASLSPNGLNETTGASIFRCLYGFFLGSLVYELWSSGEVARVRGTALEILVIATICGFLYAAEKHALLTYLAPPLFAIGVIVFANATGIVSKVLRSAPISILGLLSYSIYMIHDLLLGLLVDAGAVVDHVFHMHLVFRRAGHAIVDTGSLANNDLIATAFVVAVIAVSSVTWRWIEVPGQRYFRSFASRRRVA